jgi:SagB-type dehydrogenase family enzyme
MSLVSKWFLGQLGKLRPVALSDTPDASIELPPPHREGGMPIMQALAQRRSARDFADTPLTLQQVSDLLWAADGINRPQEHERTAPSAMNAQEVTVYLALASGLYHYDAERHALKLVAASDARRVTGLQGFVDTAPLDLVYVADEHRMSMIPKARRVAYSALCAGAIMQNVYLYCASTGLVSVARGLFDEKALREALGLEAHQRIIITQTVGQPHLHA